jgi:hypothetical protein
VDSAAEPECISLTSSSNSSWTDPTLPQLVTAPAASDQAAAACKDLLLNGPASDTAAADAPLLSASSTRRLTAAGAGAASSHTQAATHGSSSSSSAPTKPVAPVRSRAAPVQVSFTQLQTPHLPAREQREVEIKQIKRAAGKVRCSAHAAAAAAFGCMCPYRHQAPVSRSLARTRHAMPCHAMLIVPV